MAAATPAWARGMPETAALVIGALTKPKPTPKVTYAANNHVNGVVALNPTSIRQAALSAAPAMTNGILPPRRPTIRPESGGSSIVIAASGRVSMPARNGESPRTSCR